MQSNKFTNILLIIIGVLLAVLIGLLFIMNTSSKPATEAVVNTSAQNTQNTQNTQDTQTQEALFAAELAKPVNFGTHYRMVEVSCGSGCSSFYAIDKNSGSVFKAPFTYGVSDAVNVKYTAESDLVTVQMASGATKYYVIHPTDGFQIPDGARY